MTFKPSHREGLNRSTSYPMFLILAYLRMTKFANSSGCIGRGSLTKGELEKVLNGAHELAVKVGRTPLEIRKLQSTFGLCPACAAAW